MKRQNLHEPTGTQRYRIARWMLVILTVASSQGCTRAFFRQWANQDASEAIFEKSRDPRWRIDLYTIEPPSMSRYAEPYDPDHPPAPPDDYATQAMSPVPQWSQNRLLTPTEGTGYEEQLIQWQMKREREQAANPVPDNAAGVAPPGSVEREGPSALPGILPSGPETSPVNPPMNPPANPNNGTMPPAPRPDGGSPFQNPANSGTKPGETSPNSMRGQSSYETRRIELAKALRKLEAVKRDHAMLLAAYERTGIPAPVVHAQPPATSPAAQPGQAQPPVPDPRPRTVVPNDPNPTVDEDTRQRSGVPPGQPIEVYREAEEVTSEMAAILSPRRIVLDDHEVAGLPESTKVYLVDLEQAFHLTLTHCRSYQFQLENLYQFALSVTLQRFQFQPQFYAGMGPSTGVIGAGFPGTNPTNVFSYRTKYAPGGQLSSLNLGEVAGVGKLFSTGGQLLAGFANQLAFNFLGKTPIQPTVQSALPLTFVQPFLKGGGRAVTLEALTQAERNLLYNIRLFARYRQEFFTNLTVGTTFTNPGLFDPDPGFINVLQFLQTVENNQYNLAAFEQLLMVYKELAKGESSGITPLQVDQMESSVIGARLSLLNAKLNYRSQLDQLKVQFGLPPDVTISLDRSLIIGFKQTFDKLYKWAADPRRELADLDRFVEEVPQLEDMEIDGRPVIGTMYKNAASYTSSPENRALINETELEDLLLAGERVAMENRVDLMNARAQLYDAWRQIRFTANALKGVLNVSVTNQYITPTATTNPFGFLDQAKQFSLVLNTELPLVRVNERNNFRIAWINYQRQRRTLMNQEDNVKYGVRQEIRQLQVYYITYEIQKRLFVISMRVKDQAQEQIVAPPQPGQNTVALVAAQTNNLINFQSNFFGAQNNLVSTWTNYELYRLQLYRDLGIMPYDEWEALYELFPPKSVTERRGNQPNARIDGRAPAGNAAAPTQVAGR